MSNRQQEAWGGEVQVPRWLRRILRRPDPVPPHPEVAHEERKRRSEASASVLENANRAAGAHLMTDFYNERRTKRR
jgi:hypothetical protein